MSKGVQRAFRARGLVADVRPAEKTQQFLGRRWLRDRCAHAYTAKEARSCRGSPAVKEYSGNAFQLQWRIAHLPEVSLFVLLSFNDASQPA
jgi:hypothetical protein